MWRRAAAVVIFTVPVTVTLLDVYGYVAQVEGSSMQPVLNPQETKSNDYVFLRRWPARNFEFERGQIVSLTSPTNPDQQLIKRIIALGGDKVRTLSYKNLYVRIPEGHCWLEGDCHDNSMDSNLFGPVPVGLLHAKASLIVWPPHRWQRLPSLSTQHRLCVSE